MWLVSGYQQSPTVGQNITQLIGDYSEYRVPGSIMKEWPWIQIMLIKSVWNVPNVDGFKCWSESWKFRPTESVITGTLSMITQA